MKLKKITENGNYNVVMSQQEINIINDLFCYVNLYHTEHEIIKGNSQNIMDFFQKYSTFEYEELFGVNVVDHCEYCGDPLIELIPIKDQVVI